MNKLLRFSMACVIASSVTLVACHKNPLMTDASIAKLKEQLPDRYFTDDNARPCAVYYSNVAAESDKKALCDRWSENYYKSLINDGTINYKVTLDDFRDPALWKILKER